MSLAAGTRLGPYETLGLIGAGGMGEVYKAKDTRLGRTVAIKVLPAEISADPDRRARFEREAKTIASLTHPHICALHDVGEHDGSLFLVMEHLPGETLATRLAKGRLPSDQALQYGAQIADALARAHREHIVHRDLKPANIMLTRSGVKLLDFGVAKLKVAEDDDSSAPATTRTNENTVTGCIVGTSYYMSPEQAQGLHVDHRSDIFSLGIVLYEMATGARPFVGDTRAVVISSILRDTPRSLSEIDPAIPSGLSRIVRRCLQKDPEDRYQSASDLRGDLADLREETGSDSRARWRADASPAPTRRRVVFASAALALATVLTLALLAPSAWRRAWRATGSGSASAVAPSASPLPLQVTAAPGWETYPVLSADGSLVAYTSNESGNADVWVVGIGGGNAVNVSNNSGTDEKPAWFPDGTALAFASDRGGQWNVWKAPALGGGASLLVTNARDPAISPDGRQVAFVRTDGTGTPRVMVARVEGAAGARTVATPTPDLAFGEQDPAWSPDGTGICYSSYRSLWIAPVTGGNARRLTSDRENDIEPAWSPDGQSVYFSSFRGGVYAIWRISASGGTPERLTRGAGPERHPSLSRDGARLAFSTFATNADIVLRDLITGNERHLGTTRDEAFPALSPDGTMLVYASLPGAQGRGQLWRQPLVDGWPAQDPQQLADQNGTLSQPEFSPDGRWLVYQCSLNGRNEIWIMPADGGEPVKFTGDPADDGHPAWSPDGKWIAFTSMRAGGEHIFVAPVTDGRRAGSARQVTRPPGDQERPAWLSGGKRIAYAMEEPAATGIWEIDAQGTEAPQRIFTAAGVQYLRWDPRGRGLIVSGTWGRSTGLSLRLVDLRTRTIRPLESPVSIAEGLLLTFSFRRDGRFVAFSRGAFSGDIWVTDLDRSKR